MRPNDEGSSGVPPNLRELRVYQEAQECAAAVAEAVRSVPPEERFALADQMRRASSSVYANIAEGHARRSPREQLRFYEIARASLTELRAHTDQAALRMLIPPSTEGDLHRQYLQVIRLLAGLMRSADAGIDHRESHVRNSGL